MFGRPLVSAPGAPKIFQENFNILNLISRETSKKLPKSSFHLESTQGHPRKLIKLQSPDANNTFQQCMRRQSPLLTYNCEIKPHSHHSPQTISQNR